MKILFDTNVLLDVLLDRPPFSKGASILLSQLESGLLMGYVGATSIPTIHYLARKAVGVRAAKDQVELLLTLLEVAPVNRLVLESALKSSMSDFEDAILAASAHHAGIDAIITRDTRDFKNAPLPIHTPDQFLKILDLP